MKNCFSLAIVVVVSSACGSQTLPGAQSDKGASQTAAAEVSQTPGNSNSPSGQQSDPASADAARAPTDPSTAPGKGSGVNQPHSTGLLPQALSFELPRRTIETPNRTLWATFYRTPRFSHQPTGFDLLDLNGRPLGPRLTQRQWCDAAMEGSVQILLDGQWKTYNYSGSTGSVQVDCTPYFSHPVGRTRFKPARGPYGDGVRNYILSPYRTIAVDPDVIPYGSVLYIDEARGLPFVMPDGTRRLHDGYFFAADTGGLIRDTHIDVYIGIDSKTPFSWITSNPNSRIEYQIVPDADLREVLLYLHL